MKAIGRLYKYIDYKGNKPTRFEKELGLSNGYLGTQLKRNADLGESVLNKIIDYCLDINPEWLLTGNGEMLKSNIQKSEINIDYKEKYEKILEENRKKIFSVPLIPFDAVAGFNGEDNPGVRYEDCERYTVPEFERSGVEFVIRVSGSSMYPKYSNGDILACRKINNILFFQWGKIYVIDSSSQGILVKRIYEDTENPDNIILVSDNKEKYPPHPIPKSDIRSLSIVLGVIRME